jgi:hypothetical protein
VPREAATQSKGCERARVVLLLHPYTVSAHPPGSTVVERPWLRGAACRGAVAVVIMWVWGGRSCRRCVAVAANKRRRPRRRRRYNAEEEEERLRTPRAARVWVRVRSAVRSAGSTPRRRRRMCMPRHRPCWHLPSLLRPRCHPSPSCTCITRTITTASATASARDRYRDHSSGRSAAWPAQPPPLPPRRAITTTPPRVGTDTGALKTEPSGALKRRKT